MAVTDNVGRRSGLDRRVFSYAVCIPERRSGKDRRSGLDRRSPKGFRRIIEVDRRRSFKAIP